MDIYIEESSQGKFAEIIRAGKHRLMADEPIEGGGEDLGPSPYDYLLAALGSCTVMTLRLYADSKKIPLHHISVTLTHHKVYATDCKNCEDNTAKIDKIERVIDLQGELNTSQQQTLIAIANKCPVHKTLSNTTIIKTTLKGLTE